MSSVTDNSHTFELSKYLWENGSYEVLQIFIVVQMFYMIVEVCNTTSMKMSKYITTFIYTQGVTGGMDQTSGECSLW